MKEDFLFPSPVIGPMPSPHLDSYSQTKGFKQRVQSQLWAPLRPSGTMLPQDSGPLKPLRPHTLTTVLGCLWGCPLSCSFPHVGSSPRLFGPMYMQDKGPTRVTGTWLGQWLQAGSLPWSGESSAHTLSVTMVQFRSYPNTWSFSYPSALYS